MANKKLSIYLPPRHVAKPIVVRSCYSLRMKTQLTLLILRGHFRFFIKVKCKCNPIITIFFVLSAILVHMNISFIFSCSHHNCAANFSPDYFFVNCPANTIHNSVGTRCSEHFIVNHKCQATKQFLLLNLR